MELVWKFTFDQLPPCAVNLKANREKMKSVLMSKMVQVMFETFVVPAMYVAVSDLLTSPA